MLTEEQKERVRQTGREWETTPAPCGIAHWPPEIYNPCLPERDERGRLFCCTCGLMQRLQIAKAG